MQLVVIAKEPRPGRVKTRLCPPCRPTEAAAIAEAALADTLAVVAATPATRRVLLLDGAPGGWLPPGFEVIAQRGHGLGDRLSAGFGHCLATGAGPVVLVGMDTPQLTPAHLLAAAAGLVDEDHAVLGPAVDGGFWLIGMRRFDPACDPFAGVTMSTASTFAEQRRRLERCGYSVRLTDQLGDVDSVADAQRVAADVPGSRFAGAVHAAIGRAGTTDVRQAS